MTPKFMLKTRVLTHAVTPPNNVEETKLPGGPSRTRAGVLGGASYVPVSFITETSQQFNYAWAFFITILKEGSLPFLLFIPVLSDECKWLECKFKKGSFKQTADNGSLKTFTAVVEVVDRRNTADDEALVALINASGFNDAGQIEFINLLDNLVNTQIPEATHGY